MGIFVVSLLLFSFSLAIPPSPFPPTTLSAEEEQCIAEIGLDREQVIETKAQHLRPLSATFEDFLRCYVNLLDLEGSLHYTKNTFVDVPGYNIRVHLPGVYCRDKSDPHVQCAL